VDLRLSAPLRNRAALVIAMVALFAGWKTLTQWNALSREAITPWVGVTLFLGLLALWLVVGDELWHVEKNCLAHRVGFGRRYYSRNYQNAELEIIVRFTRFGVPYYRLYVVANGKQHFLIARREPELRTLANFFAFHTGWQLRPQSV
jgi:hypothetical protein